MSDFERSFKMIQVRRAQERGVIDKEWLKSFVTFSFDTFFDQKFTGYRELRVINEDRLAPSKGYGEQFLKEMEIVTYVVEGAVEYHDGLGNSTVIREGELQRISAGTGLAKSLTNRSTYQPAHLFHFWVVASQSGLLPSVKQRQFSMASKWGQWALLLSNTGRNGSLNWHQDVDLYATVIEEDDEIVFDCMPDRFYWLQVVSGSFRLMGELEVNAGDGVQLSEISSLVIRAKEKGELLLFDLA